MADPYVYESTNILRNIPGIKNQEKLDEYENIIVNLALIKLFKLGFIVQKTTDIFSIHKLIFQDVYEWAGQPRMMDIEKSEIVLNELSVAYEAFSKILDEVKHLNDVYFNMKWSKMSRSSLIYNLARYISKLWQIHPFREGNTRTVATYLYLFMQKHHYDINIELLKNHAKYFRNALVMASIGEYSEYNYLETILEDAIKNKSEIITSVESIKNKYNEIKGIKVDGYRYNYHQEKKKRWHTE